MRQRRSPSTPRVSPVRLGHLTSGDPADLDAGVLLDGVRLAGGDLAPINLAGAELIEVELDGLSADDVDLIGARLREVLVTGVRFSAVRASRGEWHESELSGRFGLLDAQAARWRSIILTGCKVDFLSLRGADVEDVLLVDCQVGELDLTGARVSRMRLASTRVGTLEAGGLAGEHLDLRGAEIERLIGLSSLRGAMVTPDQVEWWATAMAEELGLRVIPGESA